MMGLLIAGGLLTWARGALVCRPPMANRRSSRSWRRTGRFHLMRNGVPFLIKGGGGDGARKLLHDSGGNSFLDLGDRTISARNSMKRRRLGLDGHGRHLAGAIRSMASTITTTPIRSRRSTRWRRRPFCATKTIRRC